MATFIVGNTTHKKHKVKIKVVFVVITASLVFAGCGKKDADAPPAAVPPANQTAPASGGVKGGTPSDPAKELKQLQDEKKAGG